MKTVNKTLRTLLRPFWRTFTNLLPARWHVVIDHVRFFGKLPNLKNPRTFNEKIAYRKLYDHDYRLPPLIDKIVAKELMAARFGPDFIIPTLATFESEKEVDFDALRYPCVVKANHGSGINFFLKQRPVDEKRIRQELRNFLHRSYDVLYEEWAYSKIHRRLLAEPLIEGGAHGLVDYKFHTFGGRVFAIQVDVDRYIGHRRCLFNPNWVKMPVEYYYPQPSYTIPQPAMLPSMLRYAEQIGEDFSYVRVDLYEIAGQVKFGEVTFYPEAGLGVFNPPEFDQIFGAQWL